MARGQDLNGMPLACQALTILEQLSAALKLERNISHERELDRGPARHGASHVQSMTS